MSVIINSKDHEVEANVSNGTWAAAVACARAYQLEVPEWSGTNDKAEWTPEQLKIMADRLEQTAQIIPLLRELEKGGGAVLH